VAFVTQAALPILRDGGRVINLASIYGVLGRVERIAYSAAKGGVVTLTKSLALELAPRGITVNAVGPSLIETDLTRERMRKDPGFRDVEVARTPLKRLGTAEDVAGAVVYFASTEAGFVTGQLLLVDGGPRAPERRPHDAAGRSDPAHPPQQRPVSHRRCGRSSAGRRRRGRSRGWSDALAPRPSPPHASAPRRLAPGEPRDPSRLAGAVPGGMGRGAPAAAHLASRYAGPHGRRAARYVDQPRSDLHGSARSARPLLRAHRGRGRQRLARDPFGSSAGRRAATPRGRPRRGDARAGVVARHRGARGVGAGARSKGRTGRARPSGRRR